MTTTATQTKPTDMFRSVPLRSAPKRVDREAGRLSGVKVIEAGPLKDGDPRPWFVDEFTLQQVADLGNQPNKGIKSRFTHPNMSEDGLGKHLGKQKNFIVDGTAVYADFQVSNTARGSEMAEYVFDLAEEAPEDIGLSIVALLDFKAMKAEEREDGTQPMRLKGLRAVDFVDEGAATNGLFDVQSPAGIPAAVTQLLDMHFSESDPHDVLHRAVGLLERHYGVTFSQQIEEQPMSITQTPELPAQDKFSRDNGARYVEMFGDIGAKWYIDGKSVEDCFAIKVEQFQEQLAAKDEQIAELQTQLEAALAAVGEGDPLDSTPSDETPEQAALSARVAELQEQGNSEARARLIAGLESRKPKAVKPANN